MKTYQVKVNCPYCQFAVDVDLVEDPFGGHLPYGEHQCPHCGYMIQEYDVR